MSTQAYDEIKSNFAHACYAYCRNMVSHSIEGNIEMDMNFPEQGFAYEALEGSFSEPIEDLMLEIITIIFMGGRCMPKTEHYHKEKVLDILSKNNLKEMTKCLSENDKKELLYDMKILGLVEKT
ncbi:hypothetical protein R9X49_17805 [Pectobacterium carotovorum]|uniref:hypothetical protein n=1 Tax=Pectobacterium carotovorum TaxID=554 RepID=UPI0029D4CA51|nr:hypothetical protein [Pectobacterium carotovorum]MDX6916967.1 hypothetical protein [Pectobacterium carotovorum]